MKLLPPVTPAAAAPVRADTGGLLGRLSVGTCRKLPTKSVMSKDSVQNSIISGSLKRRLPFGKRMQMDRRFWFASCDDVLRIYALRG